MAGKGPPLVALFFSGVDYHYDYHYDYDMIMIIMIYIMAKLHWFIEASSVQTTLDLTRWDPISAV